MPELPEVETTVRGLAPVLDGRRIASIDLRREDLRRPFPPDLRQRLTEPRYRPGAAQYGRSRPTGTNKIFPPACRPWRSIPATSASRPCRERTEGRRLSLNATAASAIDIFGATRSLPIRLLNMGRSRRRRPGRRICAPLEVRRRRSRAAARSKRIVAGARQHLVCDALNLAGSLRKVGRPYRPLPARRRPRR